MTNILAQVITAYCACKVCCGPSAANLTAAGTPPRADYTIAAPRHIPLGTRVRINNSPIIYIVEDRLHRRYTNRWDVYHPTHNAARKAGIHTNAIVTVISPK